MRLKKPSDPAFTLRPVRAALLGLAAFGVAGNAAAERWTFAPSLNGQVTVTDNANLAPSSSAKSDVILQVTPAITVNSGQGGRVELNGTASATAYTYVSGTQSSALYPSVFLNGRLEAIEQWLWVDASVYANQNLRNPFAPRADFAVDDNSYLQTGYRISPNIRGRLFGEANYSLRSDHYWTNSSGSASPENNQYQWNLAGDITRAPTPFGWSAQIQRLQLDQRGNNVNTIGDYTTELARLVLSYRVTYDLDVNLRGGYERNEFPLTSSSGAFYGAGLQWRPSDRTVLDGYYEDRQFGSSWNLNASHRMPFLALTAFTSRGLSTTAGSLFTVPPGNVFSSLDAILTTRIPDPVERAAAVQRYVNQFNLPADVLQPVPINTGRINKVTQGNVSAVLLGSRNSLTFTLFYLESVAITASGQELPGFDGSSNTRQRGGSISGTHRLDPVSNINGSVVYTITNGVNTFSDTESTQTTYRVQYDRQLAPRTSGYIGVRHVDYTSNFRFSDYTENAAFVGLTHRF